MGRGRAKAKQTKVARDLKYQRFDTDFDQLQRELHGKPDAAADQASGDDADEAYDDPYAPDDSHTDDDTESAHRP